MRQEKHYLNLKMRTFSKRKKLRKIKLSKNLMKKNMKVESMMLLLKVKRKEWVSRKRRAKAQANSTVMLQTQRHMKDQFNEEIVMILEISITTCRKNRSCQNTTTKTSFKKWPNMLTIDSTSMKKTLKLDKT